MHDTRVVAAEFRGLSRLFVQRLEPPGAEADKIQNAAARYIAALQKRRPGKWHRPEHLDHVIALWMSQPAAGSLMGPEVLRKPHAVSLRALRLVSARVSREEWTGGAEVAVTVSQFGLDINRKGFSTHVGPLITISQHALGRRIARSFGPADDEAITADIRLAVVFFAESKMGVEHTDRSFSVPCAGGCWLGAVRRVMSQGRQFVVLDIRTFK